MGVFAFAALDKALNKAVDKALNDEARTQSKVGGNVSQADLSIHGQVSRTGATETMTEPTFSVSAKKMAM